MGKINAAPRKGNQACPDSCRVMVCRQCKSKVLVNKTFPPTGIVHCMECAQKLTAGKDSEWRFPYDKKFGELFDYVSGQNQAGNKNASERRERKWWHFWR